MSTRIWPAMGCGAGLRNKHYSFVLAEKPSIDWFEAVTENYLDTGGRPLATLEALRASYPVALHGVSLSIGSSDALDTGYLKRLKSLIERIEPFVVSDHLCWTGVDGQNLHDLLPLPFTEEALTHVARRVGQAQEFLGRPILLENVSTYVTYRHSAVPEWEFLREVARRSGCGILLDLNNVYVNSVNHRFDPARYLEEIPGKWVGQFHLAGHTDRGSFLFDTHSASVAEAVWGLYRKALELYGPVSTLIEWDEAIPDFPVLLEEVNKAKAIYTNTRVLTGPGPATANVSPSQASGPGPVVGPVVPTLLQVQREMKGRILSHNQKNFSHAMLNPQGGASGEERMAVYAEAYLVRMAEALAEVYETVQHLMGKEAFLELTESYLEAHPSHSYDLNSVGRQMPEHLRRTRFAEALPFLPDLAQLEWRVSQAFHAFQEPPFDPAGLASRSEAEWERLRVFFQPSVAVVSSSWPILDLWNARKTPATSIDIELEGRAQNVLVSRSGLNVSCELMDPLQVEVFHSLQRGEELGSVCSYLVGNGHARSLQGEEAPVGEWFSSWASRGLIARVA